MNIYSNPELYDSIHKEYNWDKNMIHSYAKKVSGSVLEIASGTGRLTQTILDLGLDYTGLEISKPFLDKAKDKYKHHAKFILGDMRNFHLNNKFDFIFIGFNSFLHNLTRLNPDFSATRCDALFSVSVYALMVFTFKKCNRAYSVQ